MPLSDTRNTHTSNLSRSPNPSSPQRKKGEWEASMHSKDLVTSIK